MEIIGLIIAGVIVGALGRLVNPGPDPLGWIVTIAIGIGAVLVTGLLLGDLGFWGYAIAVIVAAVLVTLVQQFLPGTDRRARAV
jgi:uncharacterized membrane protein YeaQ/YmgE (transglycosylase-associated protein family)